MNNHLIIQCLWIGNQISRMERLSMQSFLKNGYTVHLYSYGHIDGIPDGVIIVNANEIIPADRIFKYKDYDSYAGFANLFRYKLLMEKGGYWSDLDIVCLKPFPADEQYIFASERLFDQTCRINNCFIKAPKNSPIMEYCYLSALSKKPEELNWGQTGPELLSEAVNKFALGEYVLHPDVICPVDFWNCQYFISKSINDIIDEETYTIHLWNEIWRRNKMNKSTVYDENCMYEELQKRYNP